MKNILGFNDFVNEHLNTELIYNKNNPRVPIHQPFTDKVLSLIDISTSPEDSIFKTMLKFIELAIDKSDALSKPNNTFDSSEYLLKMMRYNTLVNFENDYSILEESVKKEFVKIKTVLQLVAKFLAKEDLEDVIPVVHEAINSLNKDNKISLSALRDILLSNLDEELTTKFFEETKILDNIIEESLNENADFNLEDLIKLVNILPKNITNGLAVNDFIEDLEKISKNNKLSPQDIKYSLDSFADDKTSLKIQRFLNIVK